MHTEFLVGKQSCSFDMLHTKVWSETINISCIFQGVLVEVTLYFIDRTNFSLGKHEPIVSMMIRRTQNVNSSYPNHRSIHAYTIQDKIAFRAISSISFILNDALLCTKTMDYIRI
jgi:hypothetical protein